MHVAKQFLKNNLYKSLRSLLLTPLCEKNTLCVLCSLCLFARNKTNCRHMFDAPIAHYFQDWFHGAA